MNIDLINASKSGNYTKARCLLETGCVDAKTSDENDKTPLHWASYNGHFDIARSLVKCGAVIQIEESTQNWTPLHMASINGHVEIVILLIESGAVINPKERIEFTLKIKCKFIYAVAVKI